MFFCSYFVQWGRGFEGFEGFEGFLVSGFKFQVSIIKGSKVQEFNVQCSRVQKFERIRHFGFALGIWILEFESWDLDFCRPIAPRLVAPQKIKAFFGIWLLEFETWNLELGS